MSQKADVHTSHTSTKLNQLKWDLGIKNLIPEWKNLFSAKYLREDFLSGMTVSFVAIPLSLAIALASGVEPAVGLVTAIVAGIVCALFGGTPLAVSGPAAAISVLVASLVQKYGLGGLLVIGLGCGFLQLITGFLNLGRLARLVPLPVITGFTAGIGAIIIIGQLPRVLGLPAPDQAHVFDVIPHLWELIGQTHIPSFILAISTLVIIYTLPKFLPRVPSPLVGVLIPSIAAALLGLNVESIGHIPSSLPFPSLPTLPTGGLTELVGAIFVVYAIASLETLLSSSAVDKLSKGKKHDSDQELIGQGLGNIASSLFGGIPVTGVIARSSLNVQAGGKTRRSAIIHSLFLLITVYFASSIISKIPVAVLAGVLFSVALRMLSPKEFTSLLRVSKSEATTYLITFFTIVFVDLLAGVQAGIVAALLVSVLRLGKTRTFFHLSHADKDEPVHAAISGPLTFLSLGEIESMKKKLEEIGDYKQLIVDLSGVSLIDISAAESLGEFINIELESGTKLCILAPPPSCAKVFYSLDASGRWSSITAHNHSEVHTVLDDFNAARPLSRLIMGVKRFKEEISDSHYSVLFDQLAEGQAPHTLFITCSDSRIDPNLITGTFPGELFIVRNVGNIIPTMGADGMPAEGAAVEFAVGVLGVKEIIICGHSGCGAMKELISGRLFAPEMSAKFPSLSQWLKEAKSPRIKLDQNTTPEEAACASAVQQMENLKTYPFVAQALKEGNLRLHAWFYNIGKSQLEKWDPQQGRYVPLVKSGLQKVEQVSRPKVSK